MVNSRCWLRHVIKLAKKETFPPALGHPRGAQTITSNNRNNFEQSLSRRPACATRIGCIVVFVFVYCTPSSTLLETFSSPIKASKLIDARNSVRLRSRHSMNVYYSRSGGFREDAIIQNRSRYGALLAFDRLLRIGVISSWQRRLRSERSLPTELSPRKQRTNAISAAVRYISYDDAATNINLSWFLG